MLKSLERSTSNAPQPGAWNGIVVREAASDRNVAAISESEPVRSGFIDNNSIPSQSQFLGELAPNEKSGDENRRLGFVIDGSVTQRSDVDVYSFIGQSGTEVFLDIDRTGNQFDSVVELIDANGQVLASSNDSALAATDSAALFVANNINPGAAQSLTVVNATNNVQEITISESIVDATGGDLILDIAGQPETLIPVADFLADPAAAIETALETAYPDQLGDITASLLRRTEREFNANDPAIVSQFGDEFVIRLQFDSDTFVGQTVPTITTSTDSILGPVAVTSSVESRILGSQTQDAYSINSKDAGLRIILPGENETPNLYHVRVRSSNTRDPLDFATLNDPDNVRAGLSLGNYELQIRLSEADEFAGTQFNQADVRYANNGLQIIGQPLSSPLLGEDFEVSGNNNSLGNAQPLGTFGAGNDSEASANILASDSASKSFAGSLSDATDVDWYSFTVNYENLTRDSAALYLSTVFDLDYSAGFARSDTALYVFDSTGQLILIGGDSNIADDQPSLGGSNTTSDLSRGSASTEDPYIGAAELSEGTYFVAVSNQNQVPVPLDQFFNANSANPLLRLEPIDSVQRIAEDRIDQIGGGTASLPVTPILFDNDSIVDYTLDDVLLYVNTGSSLVLVNPFTGENFGTVGNFPVNEEIEEVAFSANGELFAYSGFADRDRADDTFFYYRIDTSDGSLNGPISNGAGVSTFNETIADNGDIGIEAADVGLDVEAISIAALAGEEAGFFVANRPATFFGGPFSNQYNTNILYEFAPETGLAIGNSIPFQNNLSGAGTLPREVGQINTESLGTSTTQLGISAPIEFNNGAFVPSLVDGDTFTLTDFAETITFEIESGITLTADTGNAVLDGDQVTVDGQVFEFNTGTRLQLAQAQPTGDLTDGTTLSLSLGGSDPVVFEFTRDAALNDNANIPINILNTAGQPLSENLIAQVLANQINQSDSAMQATAVGDQVTFNGPVAPAITVTGMGVTQLGDDTVSDGSIAVNVSEFTDSETLISQLAAAITSQGITVISDGPQLSLPEATTVLLSSSTESPLALTQTGTAGTGTNETVLAFPGDTTETIAQRIADAVEDAFNSGSTISVAPAVSGRSLTIINGEVVSTASANGALVAGGTGQDGTITGIEVVTEANGGQNLYALDNNGGLYIVPGGSLGATGARQLGTPVATATDLIRLAQSGVTFTGLRSGPTSFNDGELRQTLFGITSFGDIYAFNTAGELQNIFAGGSSVISTGVFGARGLDFSTLGFNLFHVTNQRATDPGHGIEPLFNGTRDPLNFQNGGSSLAFTYEANAFSGNYPLGDQPVLFNANNTIANPRQDGTDVEDTFNFPAGAKGIVQSNSFDLEGFSAEDQPTLYFNYFLETDGFDEDNTDPDVFGEDRDSLRVYVVTEEGVQHLVASNTTARDNFLADDEFDDPAPFGIYDDDIDVDVQQLFDNSGSFRQARVSLGEFAGQANLSLRIEFATAGTTTTGTLRLQTTAADTLADGETFEVGGETFVIDLAPAISVPSGPQLAEFYTDPAALATITIDGQVYALDDGNRDSITTEISVLLIDDATTSLEDLSASEIAGLITDAVRLAPPASTLTENLDFSEPQDTDPSAAGGRDDRLFEAFALPYSGGNATLVGQGQLGNDQLVGDFDDSVLPLTPAAVANADDVDLFRVELGELSTVGVNVVAAGVNADALPLDVTVRFFDESGNELTATPTIDNPNSFNVTEAGTYFIGISGSPNDFYDPQFDTGTVDGSFGKYEASFNIESDVAIQSIGNLIELQGLESIAAQPSDLFSISGQNTDIGVPVEISRLLTASQVAQQVQQAIADRFTGGNLVAVPVSGSSVLIPSLSIDDAGPFVDESQRYGDQFGGGALAGTRDNEHEGVYLDDFIIGFAERGEIATGANASPGAFITDLTSQFPVPNDPTNDLVTGSYQVEIRGASEFVNSGLGSQFRTFDTNTRLADGLSVEALPATQLRDGATFEISNGGTSITFEFDQVDENGASDGVDSGNVPIPFSLTAVAPGSETIDPITNLPIAGTGIVRPQTASEVAANIVATINRSDVQALLNLPALPNNGIDGGGSSRIDLFGDVIINNNDGGLASVSQADLRGDENQDRDAQGVIIVENSRFLFNESYGIVLDHGLTATVAGTESPNVVRFPRNLVELNTESIVPGVIVQSNVIAFNGSGGLQINGIGLGADDTQSDPAAFDRIINNTIIGGAITAGVDAPSETIQGVLFEQGQISFADAVVEFDPGPDGLAPNGIFQNQTNILGAPDLPGRGGEPVDGTNTTTLGFGGTITIQFTNNLLTGSGDSQGDLIIFEAGDIESVSVEVSRDGVVFDNVGVAGGSANTIDLDAFGFGPQDQFAFVRLTDLEQGDPTSSSRGADIDAVGAISSVSVDTFEAGGIGIELVGNAAPVLLNNVISNSTTGIVANLANDLPILGGNTFYRNTDNVPEGATVGDDAQVVSDAEVLFVSAPNLVFAPAAGSLIIDSSIDSLGDRASLTTVKGPLGIPTSPILAPRLDVNGQLRVDDPSVETPSGLGERVFKDRGASDRGDLVGPRVVLLSPLGVNLGIGSGVVSVLGDSPSFFDVQLIDGLAPADVVPGTGIDDRSVTNVSVLLLRDNVPQVEGIDYRFGYNPSTNVIRLTPIAGVFEPNSTYVIRLLDATDAIIQSTAGNQFTDGGIFNVLDLQNNATRFEYETGITLVSNLNTLEDDAADGIIFEIFDGTNTVFFELDTDEDFDPINTRVIVPSGGAVSQVGVLLAEAINASTLNLSATVNDLSVQLLGTNPLSSVISSTIGFSVVGAIGTEPGFGIQIPTEGANIADSVVDGQSFVVRRGTDVEAVFEFDSDNSLENEDATPIALLPGTTLDQLAQLMANAIGGVGLGLAPFNAGFGRVVLGGDSTYSVELVDSTLIQTGFAGQSATIPIVIGIGQTDLQIAQTIADAIDGAGIDGVSTSVADRRVFLDGTNGVNGVGAVDTITISDEVGNELQDNQTNGRTELSIFVGGGFDYGDAPAPYLSSFVDNGPRHAVNPTLPDFAIGSIVSADPDALLPNADDDDGISISGLRAGFSANLSVEITNDDNLSFFLDAWFDWNADGVFAANEALRFGSIGLGRSVVSTGVNNLLVNVPATAASGVTFARFRLTPADNVGLINPTGDAVDLDGEVQIGEVEDIQLVIANNPFQNSRIDTVNSPPQLLVNDVNDSGAVTPLDALNVVNAISRNGGSIDLDSNVLPAGLPPFPDVNGNGIVDIRDALDVINYLARTLSNANGEQVLEGEQAQFVAQTVSTADAIGYAPVAGGVLASGSTRIGDLLIAETQETITTSSIEQAAESKTSVFDSAETVKLDSIVDTLAEDTSSARSSETETSDVRDQVFASF